MRTISQGISKADFEEAYKKLTAVPDIINMGRDYSDLPSPEALINLVMKYMSQGYNKQAPVFGVDGLRYKIAEKVRKLYNRQLDPNQHITITSGSHQSIYTAISTFVKEDDEVIVMEPMPGNYTKAIEGFGGKPVFFNVQNGIDWEMLPKHINSQTKLIIMSFPNNPSGKTLDKDDVEALYRLINGSRILLLMEESFEHIVFDGKPSESILKHTDLRNQTIIVNSFGRTYNTTGWQIGYIIASELLTREYRKSQEFQISSANTPMQYALSEFLDHEQEYLQPGQNMQKKRDLFLNHIDNSVFGFEPSQSTFFQLLDISGIAKNTGESDLEFAYKAMVEHQVAVQPYQFFLHEKPTGKFLRVNFALDDEKITEGARRLNLLG